MLTFGVVSFDARRSVTLVAVRAMISYAERTAPVASRNSTTVPSTSNGTAPESVTTPPLMAVTVPLRRRVSVTTTVSLAQAFVK